MCNIKIKDEFNALKIFICDNYYASTIYVKADATVSNNRLSWTNAYPNLQEAISNAFFGDKIWVASGTYKITNTGHNNRFERLSNIKTNYENNTET